MPLEVKREIISQCFFFPPYFIFLCFTGKDKRKKMPGEKQLSASISVICLLPGDLVGSWRTCLAIIIFSFPALVLC